MLAVAWGPSLAFLIQIISLQCWLLGGQADVVGSRLGGFWSSFDFVNLAGWRLFGNVLTSLSPSFLLHNGGDDDDGGGGDGDSATYLVTLQDSRGSGATTGTKVCVDKGSWAPGQGKLGAPL